MAIVTIGNRAHHIIQNDTIINVNSNISFSLLLLVVVVTVVVDVVLCARAARAEQNEEPAMLLLLLQRIFWSLHFIAFPCSHYYMGPYACNCCRLTAKFECAAVETHTHANQQSCSMFILPII